MHPIHTLPLRSVLKISSHLLLGLPTGIFPTVFSTETLYHYNKNTLQIVELEGVNESAQML
jgi:hypothetical protein